MDLIQARELAVVAEAAEDLLPLLEPFRNLRKQRRRRLTIYDREHFTAHGMKFKTVQHLRNSVSGSQLTSRHRHRRRLHRYFYASPSFSFSELLLFLPVVVEQRLWAAAHSG